MPGKADGRSPFPESRDTSCIFQPGIHPASRFSHRDLAPRWAPGLPACFCWPGLQAPHPGRQGAGLQVPAGRHWLARPPRRWSDGRGAGPRGLFVGAACPAPAVCWVKHCSDRGRSRPGDMRLAAAANEAYAASLAVSELLGCHQCGGGRGQDEVPGGRGLGAGGPSTADARTRSFANAPSGAARPGRRDWRARRATRSPKRWPRDWITVCWAGAHRWEQQSWSLGSDSLWIFPSGARSKQIVQSPFPRRRGFGNTFESVKWYCLE